MKRHDTIISGYPHFLHGGDYNPDQWKDVPGIWDQDFRLMKLAGCNAFSLGIFAWTTYEKQEGTYDFSWLDEIMDRMAAAGNKVFLATPSGARPAWMARKYPEVCRVDQKGIRNHYETRHNHCWSSPLYREKVRAINMALAKRYAAHPALAAWHVSNEYNGHCYCENCKNEFRRYLQKKYGTLEALNAAFWTGFWSHTYTDWNEIEVDDDCVDGLLLEWKRFGTWQICDFMNWEVKAIREFSSKPVTTNMMGFEDSINYYRVAEQCDFISDDRYPGWLNPQDYAGTACFASMCHDLHRSMQKKPFVLMESTPSNLNWQPYYRLKRPGLHIAEELLTVGHGADAVMYFQYRKGQGGAEKLHGAVVDHEGTEKTRVFQDVAKLGQYLKKLQPVLGTGTAPEVAVVFDWDAKDALMCSQGPSSPNTKKYQDTVMEHYRVFWEQNIPVDIIESTADFSSYKMIVAPMLYMSRPGVAQRIADYVQNGGIWVSGYLSGYVNDSNLVFLGGLPGDGLRQIFGIWEEELDGLAPNDIQAMIPADGNSLGLGTSLPVVDYAERIHPEGASVLATYGHDFYAGEPAMTVNTFGSGKAYYIAARTTQDGLRTLLGKLIALHGIKSLLTTPSGMHATWREAEEDKFLFVYNFTNQPATCNCPYKGVSMLDDTPLDSTITLPALGSQVYKITNQDFPI